MIIPKNTNYWLAGCSKQKLGEFIWIRSVFVKASANWDEGHWWMIQTTDNEKRQYHALVVDSGREIIHPFDDEDICSKLNHMPKEPQIIIFSDEIPTYEYVKSLLEPEMSRLREEYVPKIETKTA